MKKILVTGASGMIGRELVEPLSKDSNNEIIEADIKIGHDLRNYDTCYKLCRDIDECYSLVGVKGNPKMTAERPLDFMIPIIQCDTNLIRASLEQNVKKFLYTSSIAVFYPDSDRYPAWAKRNGEMLIEAIRKQYPTKKYYVVRPSNVYGRYDSFENPDSMVITNLIWKALHNSKIEVWGHGDETRDFINSRDCADWMIEVMKREPEDPINFYTGYQTSIFEVVKIIKRHIGKELDVWYNKKPVGKLSKSMPPNKDFHLEQKVTLEEGIKEAIEYARKQLQ